MKDPQKDLLKMLQIISIKSMSALEVHTYTRVQSYSQDVCFYHTFVMIAVVRRRACVSAFSRNQNIIFQV